MRRTPCYSCSNLSETLRAIHSVGLRIDGGVHFMFLVPCERCIQISFQPWPSHQIARLAVSTTRRRGTQFLASRVKLVDT